MLVSIWLSLCSSLLQYVHGQTVSFMYELYSKDEINGNAILTFHSNSLQKCVFKCDETYGCLSVNFHKGGTSCVLTNYYPIDNTMTGIAKRGWNIYFRRHFDFLKGAKAWQSSTLVWNGELLTADKAIDGDTNGNAGQNFCAHTSQSNSYWAVEFGTPGPIKEVKIHLRTDQINGNDATYTVTVCDTHNDVINNNGTLCGSYKGSDAYTHPFILTITCENTIFGRFLRIGRDLIHLVICEVFVYPPK